MMPNRQCDVTERYVMLPCLRYRKQINTMSKNTNNAQTGDISSVDAKDLKAVTLSFEKFGFLRNVTAEEAGEFMQVILDYAMTGKMPEFKDRYQKMYYQGFLDVITEQMVAATKRANTLRKSAKERSDAVKEAKKIIAKQGRLEKGGTPANVSHVETMTQDVKGDKRDVTSPPLFDDEAGIDNAEESPSDNIDVAEDLTYAHLLSVGVKKDTGSFNGEMTWSTMSEDAKKSAIAYAKAHFSGNVTSTNVPYASQFLKSKPWLNVHK